VAEFRYGSLFSGIGGLDLGLERAGMVCKWMVEIDPFCRKILDKHWPGVERHADIKNVYGTVDLDGLVKTEYDLAVAKRKLSAETLKMAAKLYESGLSIGQVANYYEITRQALHQRFQSIGVPMRPQLHFGEENHFYRGGPTASDRAQNLLETAVKRGIVKRKIVCETCGDTPVFKNGRTGIQSHHCDYNKPLEVMWLCQKCHHKWHQKNRATPLEVKRELAPVTMLAGGFP
jgi:hypothetical protein